MILIIAPRRDQHAAHVSNRLRDEGHRVARLDVAAFPGALNGTLEVDGAGFRAKLGDLDLSEVRSVWLRRCALPRVTAANPVDAAYARAQCHAFLWNLASLTDAAWANPVAALIAADGGFGKLAALRQASGLGLRVPRTCATTDPATARAFVKSCPGGAIYKPFRSVEGREIYTGVLKDDAPLDRLRAAPGILQELVPKSFEVRVVTVDGGMLATEIHSQDQASSTVDFRLNYAVPHVAHDLPLGVKTSLDALTDSLGLKLGVHDLIVTPEGEYVYLETNQQGQWLWLQDRTKQDYVGLVASGLVRLSEAGATLAPLE